MARRRHQEYDSRPRYRVYGIQMGISVSTSQDYVCHWYHLFNSLPSPGAVASSCLSSSDTVAVNAFWDRTAWMSQPSGIRLMSTEQYHSLSFCNTDNCLQARTQTTSMSVSIGSIRAQFAETPHVKYTIGQGSPPSCLPFMHVRAQVPVTLLAFFAATPRKLLVVPLSQPWPAQRTT